MKWLINKWFLGITVLVAVSYVFWVAQWSSESRSKVYDESADGAKQIADALVLAAKGNKHVLLQFGGNWCVWCLRLHALFEANKPIHDVLETSFVVVHIDTNPRNAHLLTKYEAVAYGLPVIVILNASGDRLLTKNTEELEEGGKAHSPQKVLSFLNEWTPESFAAKQAAVRTKSGAQWVQELVDEPTDGDRHAGLEHIRNKIDEALPALIGVLSAETPVTDTNLYRRKTQAYRILRELGPAAQSAIPFLIEQLTTNNHLLVHHATAALLVLGPEARLAIPKLESILEDPALTPAVQESMERADPRVWLMVTAAQCLMKLDPAHPRLVPTALAWLGSTNVICRRTAPRILTNLGPRAKSCMSALRQACTDTDETVRQRSTNALAAMGAQPAAETK